MSDWVCTGCSSTNQDWAGACRQCGIPRTTESSASGQTDAFASTNEATGAQPSPAFATPAGSPPAAPTFEPVMPGAGGLLGGIVGGLVAAVAATAIWVGVVVLSGWQVGLVAVAVGWLVGQGVVFGAEGRASVLLVGLSALLTAAALFVSEYLIVFHFVMQELDALGAGGISVLQPPDFMAEVVMESLTADPLTLLFWGIALFEAVVIPLRKVRS